MGKSALVERLLAEVPARTLVLRGRCYEQESVPFGGVDSLIDALSEYLLGLEASDVDRLLAGGVSNIAKMFPVLSRVPLIAEQRVDGPILNPLTLRELAFRELVRVVSALSQSRTLVVYVDDLQWVDADSLALIRDVFLSSGVRCLFVATLRSDSALPPDIETFVESLETIDVPRLTGDESHALWRALGAAQDGALREEALREAGGHPLFLAELVRSARAGKLGVSATARLQDVLWERILERDPAEQRFLEMTALAGAPTPYAVVAVARRRRVLDAIGRAPRRAARARVARRRGALRGAVPRPRTRSRHGACARAG
jgi:hypothetical protein